LFFGLLRGDCSEVGTAAELRVDRPDLLLCPGLTAVVVRRDSDDRNVRASLGPKLFFVFVVVLPDLGFGWRADARFLSIGKRGDSQVTLNILAMLGFGQSSLFELFLVLLLSQTGLLFTLLDFLIHLVVVGDQVVFLRFLEKGFLLDQCIQYAEACGDKLAGAQGGSAALIQLLFDNRINLFHCYVSRAYPRNTFVVLAGIAAAAARNCEGAGHNGCAGENLFETKHKSAPSRNLFDARRTVRVKLLLCFHSDNPVGGTG